MVLHVRISDGQGIVVSIRRRAAVIVGSEAHVACHVPGDVILLRRKTGTLSVASDFFQASFSDSSNARRSATMFL